MIIIKVNTNEQWATQAWPVCCAKHSDAGWMSAVRRDGKWAHGSAFRACKAQVNYCNYMDSVIASKMERDRQRERWVLHNTDNPIVQFIISFRVICNFTFIRCIIYLYLSIFIDTTIDLFMYTVWGILDKLGMNSAPSYLIKSYCAS